MSFREYMRWDGWLAVLVGVGLYVLGLADGHQGPVDAVFSGAMMIAGTGVFMRLRHRAPFRRPGSWFTAKPIAGAGTDRTMDSRHRLLAHLMAEATAVAALTIGLSHLTGFWLTYMDAGVWMVAIGVVKLGPAAAAIAQHEAHSGSTYRVVRRPLRGVLEVNGR